MQHLLSEIEQHLYNEYPREGCGILGVVKGKMQWYPCTNVAKENEEFILDSKQFIAYSNRMDIVGVVHSHPDGTPDPSEMDIKYCNTLNVPYYIFSYPGMEMRVIHPNREEKALYGREYEFGVNDCFEAIRDYLETQNIKIPERKAFEDNWWDRDLNYFTDEMIKEYGYKKVEGNMQPNDVIIFTIRETVPNHCGVYLGDDIFYHHAENRLSCRENLYPFWKKFITGVYRYET